MEWNFMGTLYSGSRLVKGIFSHVKHIFRRQKLFWQIWLTIHNKKYWEELIAYFLLLWHGPRTKKNDASRIYSLPRERVRQERTPVDIMKFILSSC
jgi:hypothetical protein